MLKSWTEGKMQNHSIQAAVLAILLATACQQEGVSETVATPDVGTTVAGSAARRGYLDAAGTGGEALGTGGEADTGGSLGTGGVRETGGTPGTGGVESPDAAPANLSDASPDLRAVGSDAPPVGCPAGQYLVIKDMPIFAGGDATVRGYSCSDSKQDAAPDYKWPDADPTCTDKAPPAGQVTGDTCASFAMSNQCDNSLMVTQQGICQATCLRCNGGCKDVRPYLPGLPYYDRSAVRDDTCESWQKAGLCTADTGHVESFFCRATCGLCGVPTP